MTTAAQKTALKFAIKQLDQIIMDDRRLKNKTKKALKRELEPAEKCEARIERAEGRIAQNLKHRKALESLLTGA